MKKSIFTLVIAVLFPLFINAQYQQVKELEAEIVSVNRFEESRLEILDLIEGISSITVSMSDFKDGSKPRVFQIEFYTDDNGFKRFDESLHLFGHIEKKNATQSIYNYSMDSMLIISQIQENDSVVSSLNEKVLFEGLNVDQAIAYREALLTENAKLNKELLILRMRTDYPNKILVVLTN
ncbi:MAG: hypothetical protein JXR53_13865 [Bacteroidales bacterium]|nr:hypothetical protein [Bacteroidales bacterium]